MIPKTYVSYPFKKSKTSHYTVYASYGIITLYLIKSQYILFDVLPVWILEYERSPLSTRLRLWFFFAPGIGTIHYPVGRRLD
jgi:carbon starvation protein CstA